MPEARTRHQPQDSVLYAVVRDHLDEFLRAARGHGALPAFIEKTFRAFLKCGIPEFGCLRLWCPACGHDDVVAFSCKKRGVCPSCSTRAGGDGAAHLVDHVLPRVPMRQWVVSYPFELNGKLAFQPALLSATERVVMGVLSDWQQARGGGQSGGVLVRHRFGSALNVQVHCHILMTDGVYCSGADGVPVFEQTREPAQTELDTLATTLRGRLHTLFKRRGLLGKHDDSNLPEQLDALGACVKTAMGKGRRERGGPALSLVADEEAERPTGGRVAQVDGLNLYASPVIPAGDRGALEKICRYLLRGPLALGRLKQRADGMLTYRLKKPDKRGNTLVVMTPVELLMRLASLIPAPRFATRRYFGVLAAGARLRKLVVPRPTQRKNQHCADPDVTRPPVQSPVKWADLLKRVWGLEALACARCGGTMKALAVLEDRGEIARFLAHLGQTTMHQRATGPPDRMEQDPAA